MNSPPALLHRDLWPAVDALRGDIGAREVLAGLDDIDTREDHARLSAGSPPR